jgi:hypothetical protein
MATAQWDRKTTSLLRSATELGLSFEDFAERTGLPHDMVVERAAELRLSEPQSPWARLTVPEVDPEVLMLQGVPWRPRKGRKKDEKEPTVFVASAAWILGYSPYWLRLEEDRLIERYGWSVPRLESKIRVYTLPFLELTVHALARSGAIDGEVLADALRIIYRLARQWGYLPRHSQPERRTLSSEHPALQLQEGPPRPLVDEDSIDMLGLPAPVCSRLNSQGVRTVADLCSRTRADLVAIPAFGAGALGRVVGRLAAHGRSLRPDATPAKEVFPGLSTRSANALQRAGVSSTAELVSLSEADLADVEGFGAGMVREVREWLAARGQALRSVTTIPQAQFREAPAAPKAVPCS